MVLRGVPAIGPVDGPLVGVGAVVGGGAVVPPPPPPLPHAANREHAKRAVAIRRAENICIRSLSRSQQEVPGPKRAVPRNR
jgi:hypothetical protein